MTARVLTLACALALLVSPALADDGSAGEKSPAAAESKDVQDMVLLAEKRPIFIRLHIQVEGKSYEAAWLAAMHRVHKFMDLDGDGKLSSTERARGSMLQQLMSPQQPGAPLRPISGTPSASMPGSAAQVETPDQLAEFLRPAMGPLQLLITAPSTDGSEQLFAALDSDNDKRLSRSEVEAAEASLRKLDQDDDGTVALPELQPFRNPYFGRRAQTMSQPGGDNAAFVLDSPRDSRAKLARRLISRYDRPKLDSRLTREEFGIDAERFERVDSDGDLALDTDELIHSLTDVQPDLEVDVRVARTGAVSIALTKSNAMPRAMTEHVRPNGTGGLALVLDGVQLELSSSSRSGIPDARQFFRQQFRASDGDNNKYLDMNESQRSGVFNAATFKLMDRDGDGKLFEQEMDEYVAQDAEVAESRTMLSAVDQGRSLFEVLDANRDQRLTVREVRDVIAKVALWDRNGDGQISTDEIPRHFRIGFGRGQPALMARFGFSVVEAAVMANMGRGNSGTGPAWFSKMDRNRDGDLSRREFLGSLADFNRLDADHNGLLDPQEASAGK